jgi:ERCC4-type nuclease
MDVTPETICCPFTVVVDTREQRPYVFDNLRSNADEGGRLLRVDTVRLALPVGDYSIFGYPHVVIERKSKEDLYASVARRPNFIGRLEKMDELDCPNVVVECSLDSLVIPPPFSKLSPKSLNRTILSWQRRYRSVHWIFAPGRDWAEAYTFRILEGYYNDQVRQNQ